MKPSSASELLTQRSFVDIDEQAACLTGIEQTYQQIERGPYRGAFITRHLGAGVTVHVEDVGITLLQGARVPEGVRAFGLVLQQRGPCTVAGMPLDHHSLVRFPAGERLDGRLAGGTRFCVIDFGPGEPGRAHAPEVLRGCTQDLERLRSLVGVALQPPRSPQHDAALRDAFDDVLERLAPHPRAEQRRCLPSSRRRHRTYQRAMAYLERRLAEPVAITDVGRAVGASRRQLELCFAESAGAGPAEVLRMLRLNAFRRTLRAQAAPEHRIGDLAAACGLWHPSRAADGFRRLFGELPSQSQRGSEAGPN